MTKCGDVYVENLQKFSPDGFSRSNSIDPKTHDCLQHTDFSEVSSNYNQIIELETYTWLDSKASDQRPSNMNECGAKSDRELCNPTEPYSPRNESMKNTKIGTLHEFWLEKVDGKTEVPPIQQAASTDPSPGMQNVHADAFESIEQENTYKDVAICLQICTFPCTSPSPGSSAVHDNASNEYVTVRIFALDLDRTKSRSIKAKVDAVAVLAENPESKRDKVKHPASTATTATPYLAQQHKRDDIQLYGPEGQDILREESKRQRLDIPWQPRGPELGPHDYSMYQPGMPVAQFQLREGDVLILTDSAEPSELDPGGYVRFHVAGREPAHPFREGDVVVRMGQFDADPVDGSTRWVPSSNVEVFVHRTDENPGLWFLAARAQNRRSNDRSARSVDPELHVPTSVLSCAIASASKSMEEVDGDLIIRIGFSNFWNVVPWVAGFQRLPRDILVRAIYFKVRDSTLGIANLFWADICNSYIFQGRRTELFHGSVSRADIPEVFKGFGRNIDPASIAHHQLDDCS